MRWVRPATPCIGRLLWLLLLLLREILLCLLLMVVRALAIHWRLLHARIR